MEGGQKMEDGYNRLKVNNYRGLQTAGGHGAWEPTPCL